MNDYRWITKFHSFHHKSKYRYKSIMLHHLHNHYNIYLLAYNMNYALETIFSFREYMLT